MLPSFTAICFVLCLLPATWKIWCSWCWLLSWVKLHTTLCTGISFAVHQADSSSFCSVLSETSEVTYCSEFLTCILQISSTWKLIAHPQNKTLGMKNCGFMLLFFLCCVLQAHFAIWGFQLTWWNSTSVSQTLCQSNDAHRHLFIKINV